MRFGNICQLHSKVNLKGTCEIGDRSINLQMVREGYAVIYPEFREPTQGQGCRCPYDYDKRGNICGGRSAYLRPGGESPRCYVGD